MPASVSSRRKDTPTSRDAALALVARAIEAMGGEAALAAVKTIRVAGTEMVWEHEYSFSAMPDAEVRESSKASFVIQCDFAAGATRIDWDRDIVRLKFRPYPTLYKYSEVLRDGTGYVTGIDSSTPTALAKLSDPPGSPMSSIRTIVTERELMRESPRLLLEAKREDSALAAGEVVVEGTRCLLSASRFRSPACKPSSAPGNSSSSSIRRAGCRHAFGRWTAIPFRERRNTTSCCRIGETSTA